ncbi:hypothetical protein CI109_106415 [Kwoniella shandongensis]|uniref:Uncharacterized protein n=1 Tax=Kwoniella shandongensis TaxID=1734106 RepID=A0A5M6C2A6_9TREE|nr:uncharacterized protein CI109_002598 [Kwoniella shandongensis]KAA5528841.1 hypothetical protein CI109_002598 [Kwoniella shandongensis]
MSSSTSTHPFLVDQAAYLIGRTPYCLKPTCHESSSSSCSCHTALSSSSVLTRNSSSTSLDSLGSSSIRSTTSSSSTDSTVNAGAYSYLTSPYAPPTPNEKDCNIWMKSVAKEQHMFGSVARRGRGAVPAAKDTSEGSAKGKLGKWF